MKKKKKKKHMTDRHREDFPTTYLEDDEHWKLKSAEIALTYARFYGAFALVWLNSGATLFLLFFFFLLPHNYCDDFLLIEIHHEDIMIRSNYSFSGAD